MALRSRASVPAERRTLLLASNKRYYRRVVTGNPPHARHAPGSESFRARRDADLASTSPLSQPTARSAGVTAIPGRRGPARGLLATAPGAADQRQERHQENTEAGRDEQRDDQRSPDLAEDQADLHRLGVEQDEQHEDDGHEDEQGGGQGQA